MYPTYFQQQYQNQFQQRPEVYMPAQMTQQANPIPGIICRMVGSPEEAAAAQIPADGTVGVFIDRGHDAIYSKAFLPNGAVSMDTYKRAEEPPAPQYATLDQLEAVLAELDKMKKAAGRGKKADDE